MSIYFKNIFECHKQDETKIQCAFVLANQYRKLISPGRMNWRISDKVLLLVLKENSFFCVLNTFMLVLPIALYQLE